MNVQPNSDSLTRQLAALLERPITADDRQRAALHLLDWLGCAALGYRSPVGQKLAGMVRSTSHQGKCRPLFEKPSDWQSALWLNGAVGNVIEMDDVHRTSILHPGPVVVPAALAAAQHQGASPERLLDAIVCGYEATIRIGRALGGDHYRFYHNTASCGAAGAAVAVARIIGLNQSQTVSALGNAISRTGGLWQMRNEAVDTKQFHNVDAALTGSLAAHMAGHGISGPEQILEGPQGFFAATSPQASPEQVAAEPDAHWLIYQCSFKPWPACRHAHAVIDAVRSLDLSEREKAEVSRIEVATYRDALTFCDCKHPNTELQAKFSLQHAMAVCLAFNRPGLQHFKPDCFNDPEIAAVRECVSVAVDPEIDQVYPQHYGARVTVVLHNGSVREGAVRDAWGDPENPLSRDDVVHKAQTLLEAASVPPDQIEQLITAVQTLPEAADLTAFNELLSFGERVEAAS